MNCDHCRRPRIKMFVRDDLVLCSGCMLRYLVREGVISLANASGASEETKVHA